MGPIAIETLPTFLKITVFNLIWQDSFGDKCSKKLEANLPTDIHRIDGVYINKYSLNLVEMSFCRISS